jgi:uncharacterized membrane protein
MPSLSQHQGAGKEAFAAPQPPAENAQTATAREEVKQMSAMIVVAFRDAHRAAEVLVELRRREWDWIADLDHAVVVGWNSRGNLRVQLSVDPTTKDGGAWARVWGSLLHLTLLVPNTDGMTEAAGNVSTESGAFLGTEGANGKRAVLNANWWKKTLRISDEFIRDIGAMIQPGDSAVFMFLQTPKLVSVLKQLRNYGGMLLHTSLSQEQEETLKDALAFRK